MKDAEPVPSMDPLANPTRVAGLLATLIRAMGYDPREIRSIDMEADRIYVEHYAYNLDGKFLVQHGEPVTILREHPNPMRYSSPERPSGPHLHFEADES